MPLTGLFLPSRQTPGFGGIEYYPDKGAFMPDELTELLDTAILKEVAAEALYAASQSKTDDPTAKALMKELAKAEAGHAAKLKQLKEKGFTQKDWRPERVTDLKVSDYLTGGDTLEGAGLQDTLIFAMKREQSSIDFYTRLTATIRDSHAKRLCESLVHEELKHKLRLETLYDDLFYTEN